MGKLETSDISGAMKRVGRHQFFVSLINVLMGLVAARMAAKAVTLAIAGDVKNTCRTAVVLTAMVIILRAVTAFAKAILKKEKSKVLQEYRMCIYRELLQLPLTRLYFNDRGRSMEGLTDDLDEAAKRDMELKPELFVSMITVISYGTFIGYYSPVTAGILVLLSLLQLFPPLIVRKYMQVNYDDCREIEARLDVFFLEAYRGFSTMKLYGLSDWMVRKLKGLHTDYTRIGNRSILTGHAESSMETLLQNILQYGTYGLIGYLVLVGLTSMEAAVSAVALSSSFFAAVLSVFQTIPEFGTVKVAEKRLHAWLAPDAERVTDTSKNGGEAAVDDGVHTGFSDTIENTGTMERNSKENSLAFDAVWYQYSEQSITIRDFSETVETGVTLIRGVNGSGKSTLLKLAAGLLPVQSGTLTVQGVQPDRLPPGCFPRDILFLPQEDLKIAVSPAELYGMVEGLSHKEAFQCALSFGLTREQLENQKIAQLSSGQRKKVYLAMAFTLGSPILLLDEPDNGLDAQGEERLFTLLADRKKAKIGEKPLITVVVTHDSALDKAADRLIVLAPAPDEGPDRVNEPEKRGFGRQEARI
ncbi:MAG: ABC transporter ATP-binding protein/permease [Lachnospiraceae bacterium]|nr:ABC transporter ATP-binding protein/permease [Lachnospiraceae bacterium]